MVPSPGGISPVTLGRPSAGPNRLAHCPTRRSRPGCWPCRQGREKISETLPRKRAGRTGRRSQGSRTLIRQWTLYRYVGAQGQLRDPDHRHGARPGGARSRPARAGARADKYRTRVTFIGRDSSRHMRSQICPPAGGVAYPKVWRMAPTETSRYLPDYFPFTGRDHEHHREGGAAGCTGPPPPGRVFSQVASPQPPLRIPDSKRTWV